MRAHAANEKEEKTPPSDNGHNWKNFSGLCATGWLCWVSRIPGNKRRQIKWPKAESVTEVFFRVLCASSALSQSLTCAAACSCVSFCERRGSSHNGSGGE
jgi:hypothetical protein